MNFFLYYIIPICLVLGILILFHELGHFIFAKLFRVKVIKFSLGFGPKLFGKRIGETEYLISAIPFGGYVKMLGEGPEDEPVPFWEKERAFSSQPVFKRFIIVSAGPLFNLILAFLIFFTFYLTAGEKIIVPEVGKVKKGSPAFKAGIKPGDLILSIDGICVKRWEDIREIVKKKGKVPMEVLIKRKDRIIRVRLIPEEGTTKNIFGEEVKTVMIGIIASGKTKFIKLSFFSALSEALLKTWKIIKLTCLTLLKLIERIVPLKTIGGPILIGQMTGKIAQENWLYLIPFTAVLSINLGVINLLPIPILDGGILVLLIIEALMRRPIDQKVQETVHKVGIAILICLMAIVMYNDIMRILTKE